MSAFPAMLTCLAPPPGPAQQGPAYWRFVVALLSKAILSGLALQDTVGNCISCQTVDERTEILKLISEHRNRHGFRRLWPATAVQQEELEVTVSSASCICHCRAAVSG